jgi:hypothetical protein
LCNVAEGQIRPENWQFETHRPDTSGFKPQRTGDEVMNFMDELFASANPNPSRKDCLSLADINEFAMHKRCLTTLVTGTCSTVRRVTANCERFDR